MIYRGPGFPPVVWFGSSPSLVSKLSLFLSLLVCRRSSLLTGDVAGGRRSQIIRRCEGLVLYKSFNTLWRKGVEMGLSGVQRGGSQQRQQRDEKRGGGRRGRGVTEGESKTFPPPSRGSLPNTNLLCQSASPKSFCNTKIWGNIYFDCSVSCTSKNSFSAIEKTNAFIPRIEATTIDCISTFYRIHSR